MMAYSAEFKLSVTRALSDQMAQALEALRPAVLSAATIEALPPRPGVYQLYKDGKLVYVGKADQSLPQRLERHRTKVGGRLNVELSQMTFTCLYVDEDLDALAPERMLIDRFKSAGQVSWNFNGFGSNDPGQERDTTRIKEDHFDALYPIDLSITVSRLPIGDCSVAEAVRQIKVEIPYLFRFASVGKRPHPDLISAHVVLPPGEMTVDHLFGLLIRPLPSWQITALPGYVIMYPTQREYPSAQKVYR